MALGHWADGLSIATKSLILDRELEELTGRRHVVRKPGHAVGPKSSAGAGRRIFADRWRAPADLRWPSPGPDGRPKSASGATSFHMRMTNWSRPAEGGGSSTSSTSGGGHGAASFDIYVTDGLALKQIDGAGFDRYAADGVSPHDPEPAQGSRVAFMITNIDDDPDRRTAFWEERHLAARRRGDHAIELVPVRGSIEQWCDLEADKHLPSGVRNAVAQIVSALVAEPHVGDRKGKPRIQRVRLESASDIAWAAALGERFGSKKTQRMLHYVRPRGGQVQHRFEVEMPAGLDRTEIFQIASDLAALIGTLKLPFLIAVHRPDADNDPRNWHLHLIYYPQPGERNPDGKWMFGKAADGEGMLRPGDIARSLNHDKIVAPGEWYKRGASEDLRALRAGHARICNAVLERVGNRRRLDARSFKDMGIAKAPERHLGTDEARLFFTGVATATSRLNANRRWQWIIRQRHADIDIFYDRLMAPIDAERGVGDADEGLRHERDRLIAERDALAADRRELALVDARLEVARSSAKRVKANCEQTLERIAAGDAARGDVRSEDAIRARLRLADHHLAEIADAVEPWLDQMEAFRRGIERREEGSQNGVKAWLERAREQRHKAENMSVGHDAEPEKIGVGGREEFRPVAAEASAAHRPVEAAMIMACLPTWAPAFLLRSHGIKLAEVGALVGPPGVLGGLAGTVLSGMLATRLIQRSGNRAAGLIVPIMALPLAIPGYALFLFAPSLPLVIVGVAIMNFMLSSSLGPCVALAVSLVSSTQRGVTSTLLLIIQTLIAFALAPFIVGVASDALRPIYGDESLRYGLSLMLAAPLMAAILIGLARHRIRKHHDMAV